LTFKAKNPNSKPEPSSEKQSIIAAAGFQSSVGRFLKCKLRFEFNKKVYKQIKCQTRKISISTMMLSCYSKFDIQAYEVESIGNVTAVWKGSMLQLGKEGQED
jgi:hypothetical protein